MQLICERMKTRREQKQQTKQTHFQTRLIHKFEYCTIAISTLGLVRRNFLETFVHAFFLQKTSKCIYLTSYTWQSFNFCKKFLNGMFITDSSTIYIMWLISPPCSSAPLP